MIKAIKKKFRDYIFKDYRDLLDSQTKAIKDLYQAKIDNATINDLIREQLKGFDIKLLNLDNSHDVWTDLAGEEEVDVFLTKCHQLRENESLNKIIDWLIREQMIFMSQESNSVQELNFGRATINGLSLFREKVVELDKLYVERHKPEEVFDSHKVL
jgi:hypothetical protein